MCREAEEKGRVKKFYAEGRKDVKNHSERAGEIPR